MEQPTNRRTVDLPTKPEAGLAEWTSKIKALQRQVDADEEAEHKRLEEEITASRLARLRRSTGYSQPGTLDLSTRSEYAHALKDDSSPSQSADNAALTPDRQRSQDDALRKLVGESRDARRRPPVASPPTSSVPMSLAAFIGGRATGPRLTRHAPQQDGSDPTQFEQHRHITAPHPVFGRGGIAMPGMVGRGRTSASPVGAPEVHERDKLPTKSDQLPSLDRKISTPSIVKTYVERAEEQAVVVQRTDPPLPRKRTISTPAGSPATHVVLTRPATNGPKLSRPLSHTPAPRSITSHEQSKELPHIPPPSSGSPVVRSVTSPHTYPSPSTSPTTSPKPPVAVPSLARPIQPSPRQSLGPQVPASVNPSPAFLRTSPPKDPTPSISRLQGRGFVQSMVKASSELEKSAPTNPSSPVVVEKRDSGAKKSAPVLDRWQFAAGGAGAAALPPVVSPKPAPLRKSRTADPSWTHPDSSPSHSPVVKSDHTGRSVKSTTSLPPTLTRETETKSLPKPHSEAGGIDASRPQGLGSANTMIAYIRPTKTGENSAVVTPPPPVNGSDRSPEVDELGVRIAKSHGGVRDDLGKESGGLPPPSGKPLSHLTKDRAKKPRKGKASSAAPKSPSPSSTIKADDGRTALLSRNDTCPNQTSRTPELVAHAAAQSATEPALKPPVSPPPHKEKPALLPKHAVGKKLETEPTATALDSAIGANIPRPPVAPISVSPISISVMSSEGREKSPHSPRNARIPSTGNRATVMDVAQTFHELAHRETAVTNVPALAASQVSASTPHERQQNGLHEIDQEAGTEPDVRTAVADWGHRNGGSHPATHSDMRKSTYDRYSAIALPPVEEEKTPAPSPSRSLLRNVTPASIQEGIQTLDEQSLRKEAELSSVSSVLEPLQHPPEPKVSDATRPPSATSKFIRIECTDEPLPKVDIDALLNDAQVALTEDGDLQPISVEIMSVIGNTATPVMRDTYIFYDNELLAVVYRAKTRTTGLVSTKVWAWQGKCSTMGEREERKLQDLARRYGTSLISVHQYCEPVDFVSVLGGKLVTRQGTRTHWTAENTTMHVVRSIGNAIYIDELEFGIRNLCSGFSYCLSLLDTLYLWHGCGSTESERRAALEYAQSLASQSSNVIELVEGEFDNDEMFWMILGEGEYAKADYWKWRPSALARYPRLWVVDTRRGSGAIYPVASFCHEVVVHDSVFVVDCIWEYFIIVGSEARGKRQDIRLALTTAQAMSIKTATSRPFAPTVHVLILPTQIPTDLRLNFRDLDEAELNCGIIPDHMNIIPVGEAEEHLRRTTWELSAVQDPTMLPLAVHSSSTK